MNRHSLKERDNSDSKPGQEGPSVISKLVTAHLRDREKLCRPDPKDVKDNVTNQTVGLEVEPLCVWPLQPGRDDPLANPFGQKHSWHNAHISKVQPEARGGGEWKQGSAHRLSHLLANAGCKPCGSIMLWEP